MHHKIKSMNCDLVAKHMSGVIIKLAVVVVIPKEGLASTNPFKPSFGMTTTRQNCNHTKKGMAGLVRPLDF